MDPPKGPPFIARQSHPSLIESPVAHTPFVFTQLEPFSLYEFAYDLAVARLDERLIRDAMKSRFFDGLAPEVHEALEEAFRVSVETYRTLMALSTEDIRALARHLTLIGIPSPSPEVLRLLVDVYCEYLDLEAFLDRGH